MFLIFLNLFSCLITPPQDKRGNGSSRQRDDAIRNHKEEVLQLQMASLHRLQKEQGDSHRLEIRKFRRRKLLQYHQMEQNLLRDVCKFKVAFFFSCLCTVTVCKGDCVGRICTNFCIQLFATYTVRVLFCIFSIVSFRRQFFSFNSYIIN